VFIYAWVPLCVSNPTGGLPSDKQHEFCRIKTLTRVLGF
jgi:hypothetical protein